jgi:hypothetical protein
METIEVRDYMQSALDMDSRTYYASYQEAHKQAVAEYETHNITAIGASCVEREGKFYYRIEFYVDNERPDTDNMAIVTDDFDKYLADAEMFCEMNEWAMSSEEE